jgi:hypothetical protein
MQFHYRYQDTKISLKIGFKNIQRSSPTRDQNWPIETQAEETNQDANLADGFAVITTTLNKLNLTNMPSSTKEYLVRTATLLQNRANDIRQQQLQQQDRKIILETSRTKRGDVLDSQELVAVWEQIETLQTMKEALREQQLQAILDLGVELQDILKEIKNSTMPIPCLRETWLHLLNPLRTPRIPSLTPQGNRMMGLHCKIPEFLRTHISRTRHGTIPPVTQLQSLQLLS